MANTKWVEEHEKTWWKLGQSEEKWFQINRYFEIYSGYNKNYKHLIIAMEEEIRRMDEEFLNEEKRTANQQKTLILYTSIFVLIYSTKNTYVYIYTYKCIRKPHS